jgi:hypothetical protein
LRVELQCENRTLRFPTIGQELFGWVFDDRTVTVHGFISQHPYLWENLDAVMTAAGGRRDTPD